MVFELHHSAVITGFPNCFCLACDSILESRKDAFCHIETASHRENLNAAPYLDKFKDQHVRQFKSGYYCEFCNLLMSTTIKVNLHLAEDSHKQNRGINLLNLRHDIMTVLIKTSAWHGLMDNVCCICDTEFEDEADHKANTSHILSLIQRPVKFGVNEDIYRKIDDSSIQCLTCNKLLPVNIMNKHFDSLEHRHLNAKYKLEDNNDNPIDTSSLNDTHSISKDKNSYGHKHEISKIMMNDTRYQDNDIDINYETESAFFRNCSIYINFNDNDLEKHIEKHLEIEISTSTAARYPVDHDRHRYCPTSETEETVDAKSKSAINDKDLEYSSTEAYNFAKDNDITYNSNSDKSFCRMCQVQLTSSLKSMEEHVKGIPHNKKIGTYKTENEKKKTAKNYTTKTLAEFIKSLIHLDSLIGSGFFINGKCFVSDLSMILMKKNSNVFQCMLCKVTLVKLSDCDVHNEECTNTRWKKCRVVITSEANEFVREIQPGTFHCAHCHIVVTGWSAMELHLKSSLHDRKKSDSFIRHDVIRRHWSLATVCFTSLYSL